MVKENKEPKNKIVKRFFLGRWIPVGFYKKHSVAIFLVIMLIMISITVKFTEQLKQSQILQYKSELKNERAKFLKVSIEYQNKTRESEMQKEIERLNLPIGIPEQPAYNLDKGEAEK